MKPAPLTGLLFVLCGCANDIATSDGGTEDAWTGMGTDATTTTCADEMRNGDETGVDCGGARCAGCALGVDCRVDRDCLSGRCEKGFCTPSGFGFVAAEGFDVGFPAGFPAIADLDEDGLLDAALWTWPGDQALLDDAALVLGLPGRRLSGLRPLGGLHDLDGDGMAAGDLDGDGHADLVACYGLTRDSLQGHALVFLGDGKGAMTKGKEVLLDGRARTGFLADVTGDRRADLVVVVAPPTGAPGSLAVVPGDGAGGFGAPRALALDGAPFDVAIGDVDRDGIKDIVVAGEAGVEAWLGGPNMRHVGATALGDVARGLDLADLDGDGRLDAVALVRVASAAVLLEGSGDGRFAAAGFVGESLDSAFSVATGDLDGDGRPEVIAQDLTRQLRVHRNRGALGFEPAAIYPADGSYMRVRDFDGDWNLDVAVSDNWFRVFYGRGDGTLVVAPQYGEYHDGAPVVADFDNDGRLDIATTRGSYGDSGVVVYKGDGRGGVGAGIRSPCAYVVRELASGDFNGDGKLDLLAASNGASVFLGHGDLTFTAAAIGLQNTPQIFRVAVSDVDGDGHLDAVLSSSTQTTMLPGRGDGTFAPARHVLASSGNTLIAVDLNRDGKMDLVTGLRSQMESVDRGFVVLLGKGDGAFGDAVRYAPPDMASAPATVVADLDGDGNLDVVTAVQYSSRGLPQILHYPGIGDGHFGAPRVVDRARRSFSTLAVADFNRDGRADIVDGDLYSGDVRVLLARGGGRYEAVADFRLEQAPTVAQIAVGDLDGDGWLDLVSGRAILINRAVP